MKPVLLGAVLAATSLTFTTPAYAGTSKDFAGCDGLKKPKRKNDGMRGKASEPGYFFPGMNSRPSPEGILASCNRALASDKLRPEQTLRKAHLLRARAAAQIELGNTDAAMADIEQALALTASSRGEFFFDRSMGISLELLRALALSEKGEKEAALKIAEDAAQARPYALPVQMLAVVLRDANRTDAQVSGDVWSTIAKIDPSLRKIAAKRRMQSGDFATLVEMHGGAPLDLEKPPVLAELIGRNINDEINRWTASYGRTMHLIYAHAAVGENEKAQAYLAEVHAALGSTDAPSDGPPSLESKLKTMVLETRVELVGKLVEGRIAINEGRLADAAAAVEGLALRSADVTEDYYEAYNSARASHAEPLPELPELAPAAERKAPKFASLANSILIPPETPRKRVDYKQSRRNILGGLLGGQSRTTGFRSTENENGTIKVEYTGETISGPVVQEMTMLRAAEIAREQGKSHFVIDTRRDYQRYLTTMVNYAPTSRVLAGYKTELTIRVVDAQDESGMAIDAVGVIDALGPVYYDEARFASVGIK